MNTARSLLLLISGLLAAAPSTQAAEPANVGPVLEAEAGDAEWIALFSRLSEQGSVRATFTESRWFSVRKEPVVLQGELRHSPDRGLSLHYTAPRDQVMIVDARGLLMRDDRGKSRELPADSRTLRIDAVLLPVLRFDLQQLRRFFTVHAARDGADWRLDFVPLTPELDRQLGRVTLFGAAERVQRIEFRRAANQRVVVRIEHTETKVSFSPEELQRFFR